MCAVFIRESVVTDTDDLYLLGLSDLLVRQVGLRVFLYAAGEFEGGLNSFEVMPDGGISYLRKVALGPLSGTDSVAELSLVKASIGNFILPAGRYSSGATTYKLTDTGGFLAGRNSTDSTRSFDHFSATDSVSIGSSTFVYASRWGEPGLQWFQVAAYGKLTKKGAYADTATTFIGDVRDIEVAKLLGKNFLFTASGTEPGVQSYIIRSDGSLLLADKSGPTEIWGYNAPAVLESAQIGTRAFLVMGAAESGTLTVYSVASTGALTPVDHMIDSRDTRFDKIQALTKFEIAGRVFLLAGGGDDGVTLLQLSPYGKLSVVTVIADDFGITLDNISSIQIATVHGQVRVFVGSASEHGFTSFLLDLGNLGSVLRGTDAANTINGTLADDQIYGLGGWDRLFGGNGNDRLADGSGSDRLTGGPGQDIFEFADDGKLDTVTDFELGIDRLDLSDFPLIYHFSELAITIRAYGHDIVFGDDTFAIFTAASALAEPFEFSQRDFVFG